MLKKQKVVLLPTNEKAENCLWMGTAKDSILLNKLSIGFPYGKETHSLKPYYLYVLSDDKIEQNDWVFDSRDNTIYQIKLSLDGANVIFKVIATTDSSLQIKKESRKIGHLTFHNVYVDGLPKPSQSFINKYIEKYNKGEIINEIMVEYEEEKYRPGVVDCGSDDLWDSGYNEPDVLKVNSKDNTITIKAVKESWNRAEVKDLIYSFRNSILIEVSKGQVSNFTDNWIEQNL
jgi:hypothetical protein